MSDIASQTTDPLHIYDDAGDRYGQEWEDETEWDDDREVCPTCNGHGTVNPLTAPAGFFCVSYATCPHCEGSGNAD